MRLQHLSSFSCDLVSWWAHIITQSCDSGQWIFHSTWGFISRIFSRWLKSQGLILDHTHPHSWNDHFTEKNKATHTHIPTPTPTPHPPLTHTHPQKSLDWAKSQKRERAYHRINTLTSKWMGLTAAWCHQVVLQHTEQDKRKIDELDKTVDKPEG